MGKIKVEKNVGGIEGLCIIEPTVYGDKRGYFMETYNEEDMKAEGLTMKFVQDNQSSSVKGVLRGLHFQKEYPQGKLVRVVRGKVFDVAVDIRKDSETYGKWYGIPNYKDCLFLLPVSFLCERTGGFYDTMRLVAIIVGCYQLQLNPLWKYLLIHHALP